MYGLSRVNEIFRRTPQPSCSTCGTIVWISSGVSSGEDMSCEEDGEEYGVGVDIGDWPEGCTLVVLVLPMSL